MNGAFKETEEWRKGALGENTVEGWLWSIGHRTTRLCQIENRDGISAPMIMGAEFNTIQPDFLVLSRKKPPFLVEVKYKTTAPICYKLACVHVHGIGQRNWNHYLRAIEFYQCPLWLVIFQADCGELLGMPLTKKNQPHDRDDSDKNELGGMVYWRKSRFVLLAQLEPINLQADFKSMRRKPDFKL